MATNLDGASSLDTAIVWRSYHDKKLCSTRTITDRFYTDTNGQVAELDVDKVISSATKDASPALANILKSELQLLLGWDSTEEERADFWSLRGQRLSEKCTINN